MNRLFLLAFAVALPLTGIVEDAFAGCGKRRCCCVVPCVYYGPAGGRESAVVTGTTREAAIARSGGSMTSPADTPAEPAPAGCAGVAGLPSAEWYLRVDARLNAIEARLGTAAVGLPQHSGLSQRPPTLNIGVGGLAGVGLGVAEQVLPVLLDRVLARLLEREAAYVLQEEAVFRRREAALQSSGGTLSPPGTHGAVISARVEDQIIANQQQLLQSLQKQNEDILSLIEQRSAALKQAEADRQAALQKLPEQIADAIKSAVGPQVDDPQ